MTCLPLLRSSSRDAARPSSRPPGVVPGPPAAAPDAPARCRLTGRLGGEDRLPQFVRFVLVGGTSSLVYAALFVGLLDWGGAMRANIVGAVVSTALANELHRRLTFHAGGRVAWLTAQVEGGGLTLAGMAATTLALAALAVWTEQSGAPVQLLVIGSVTGAVGLVRFAALRWLFRPRAAVLPAGRDTDVPPAVPPALEPSPSESSAA